MKIAYMHFHLKTGGVTTVIRQQVEALQGTCETLVLAGGLPEGDFPCPVIVVPGIGYDTDSDQPSTPVATAQAVFQAIKGHWPGGCDVLHVHNPTLAKNKNYLKILKILKEKGIRLFLQIHDFAEDGRPGVYFHENYPADCHYGVINSRDYAILIKAGLTATGLHLVSNMVTPLPVSPGPQKSGSHILYPIRAIRRKNIGEAILLSIFFPGNKPLLLTQPPNSPADFPAYESWKQFVTRQGLNIEFEAGQRESFVTLVQDAELLLTTSISEGFGFSFMEPWTAGKRLWGRDLPGITDDFKTSGIKLNHLYTRLRVPVKWTQTGDFRKSWIVAVRSSTQAFQLEIRERDILAGFERMTADGTLDFGLLNERHQQAVVATAIESTANKAMLVDLNPFLADCGRSAFTDEQTENNRERVLEHYSQTAYRRLLEKRYTQISTTDPVQAIHKDLLLEKFFNLNNFSLLKWGLHDS